MLPTETSDVTNGNMNARNPTLLTLACLALAGCFPEHAERTVAGTRVVTLQHDYTNTHAIVGGDGRIVLVDSGLERNVPALEKALTASGLDPSRIVAVVLTHGHADHAGGAKAFQQQGAVVIAGAADEPLLRDGQNDPLCPTNADARGRLAADQAERYQGLTADVQVTSTTSLLERTGLDAEVVAIPGHTPGSLVVRVGQSVFVGDLLRGSVFGSDAEVHFYMCDVEANRRDVQALLARWPDVSTWFVGHFGPLTRAAVQAKFGAKP